MKDKTITTLILTLMPGSPGGPESPGNPIGPYGQRQWVRNHHVHGMTLTEWLTWKPEQEKVTDPERQRLTRLPLGPSSPGVPLGPGGPAAPGGPESPFSPTSPLAPWDTSIWKDNQWKGGERESEERTRPSKTGRRDGGNVTHTNARLSNWPRVSSFSVLTLVDKEHSLR